MTILLAENDQFNVISFVLISGTVLLLIAVVEFWLTAVLITGHDTNVVLSLTFIWVGYWKVVDPDWGPHVKNPVGSILKVLPVDKQTEIVVNQNFSSIYQKFFF